MKKSEEEAEKVVVDAGVKGLGYKLYKETEVGNILRKVESYQKAILKGILSSNQEKLDYLKMRAEAREQAERPQDGSGGSLPSSL